MSAISLTRLYDLLVPKLGKEATESLIIFNESKIKSEVEDNCKHLATKEDIASTKEDIASTKKDIASFKADMASNIASINEKLARLDGKIDAKVSESKAEIIRWMFIFWVGQVIATTASILLFLKR